MNSWFLYEFMVCLMGPILANIADNLVKIDYGMLPMMLGSGTTRSPVSFRASVIMFLSSRLCVVICVLARLKLAKAS